ncbi:MAG: transglycosylase SLT domain-containing protein [Solidesulfovibrio sp. DCME]|uniref:transglycosylase SLT domain-containing protein n=1 Tax=Solidesulfovibrio sp. DCME TaxID=3447380 RepID=UPI003D0DDBF9
MTDAGNGANIDILIQEAARNARLPIDIVRPVVIQESTGNPFATRFEPAFYERYLKGKPVTFVPNGCSRETERIGRAMSWGLMQIMGETARFKGFRGWFGELLLPETGLFWGCRYLAGLRDKYFAQGGWPGVLRAYNGGPGNWDNPGNHYPDAVLSHIPGGAWPTTEVSHG